MKLSEETILKCEVDFNYALPHLIETLGSSKNSVLLIGAALLDVYITEGWIDRFSRQTGDVDFSLEYLGETDEYQRIIQILMGLGYQKDASHPYRYIPAKRTGIYSSLDLLIFTTTRDLEVNAKRAMGVGEDFNFEGMDYAKKQSMIFKEKIYFPNPLGFLHLKARSFFHNADKRKKDLADFVELILRLATSGTKILRELNSQVSNSNEEEHEELARICDHLIEDDHPVWDLDAIEIELIGRRIDEEFGDTEKIRELIYYFKLHVFG